MIRAARISLLFACGLLALAGCTRTRAGGTPTAQAGTAEVTVVVQVVEPESSAAGDSRRAVVREFPPREHQALPPGTGLLAGISDAMAVTQRESYQLVVLYVDQASTVWRDTYGIGTRFTAAPTSQQGVQQIAGQNGGQIVVVEPAVALAAAPRATASRAPAEAGASPAARTPPSGPATSAPASSQPAPAPTITAAAWASAGQPVNMRAGPGPGYPLLGQMQAGESYPITGKSSDGAWWQICCANGQPAWIPGWLVDASGIVGAVLIATPGSPPPPAEAKPPPGSGPTAPAVSAGPAATPLPACAVPPGPSFARSWDRERLGCPTGPERAVQSAYESFERGWMLWRGDTTAHYVFFGAGTYRTFLYPPAEPPAFACADAQALGRPRRGFSTVWCTEPGVRGQLGSATGDEVGDARPVQEFEHGFMVYIKERDRVVSAAGDGAWQEQP